jgi:antitoxin PrlF
MSRQSATVTSKGQITIPRDVRRALGLETGDKVDFLTENGRTVICRSRGERSPFAAFVGALPVFKTKREIKAWIAEIREPVSRRK